MHSQGVAGKKIYLGGDCKHCHMYGLINVAAFLAQAMKETIRYDACDENSWDRVGDDLMYPISNACGQLGQSYQVSEVLCFLYYLIIGAIIKMSDRADTFVILSSD